MILNLSPENTPDLNCNFSGEQDDATETNPWIKINLGEEVYVSEITLFNI
jgi:hypothetical protein